MKRMLAVFIWSVAAVCHVFAQATSDPIAESFSLLNDGQFDAALVRMEDISNPAAKLFVKACVEQAQGKLEQALETVTMSVVQYPNDSVWTAKSELMSAALYIELGQFDSAEAAIRQIQLFHEGTDAAEKAAGLRGRIEQLKKQAESEEGNES
jgi:tetratricopeptide (TPR) repeat protein